MKLGLQLGYWGAQPPRDVPQALAEAERLDFDSVWTAEAYGSDAATIRALFDGGEGVLRVCDAAEFDLDHVPAGRSSKA